LNYFKNISYQVIIPMDWYRANSYPWII